MTRTLFSTLLPSSLAARLLWRRNRDQGLASDSQLVPVDQLQDHLTDLPAEELEKLELDVRTFLRFWSCGTKQHPSEYISHIFGIVSKTSSEVKFALVLQGSLNSPCFSAD